MLGAVKIRGPGIQDVFNLVREIKLLFRNQLENKQELNYENDERRERTGGKEWVEKDLEKR